MPIVDFLVLGHRLRATNPPPEIEHWLRHAWHAEDAPAAERGSTIDLAFGSAPPRQTHIYEGAETASPNGAALIWLRHGERWWRTGQGDAGVDLRLFDDGAEIRAWPSTDASEALRLGLHVAMCEALRARGLVPLHAAVAVRNGRATAFIGRRGVGKSSTLLASVESGWLPLAEDFAWLDPATREVRPWAGDRGVHLYADGVRQLSTYWQDAPWRSAPDDKRFLAYEAISTQRATSARLTRVIVLHRAPLRDCEMEPLGAEDAARALWACAGVPLCPVSRAGLEAAIPSLLTDLEWARLVLGRDPGALE